MDKEFWDGMVKLWCRVTSFADLSRVAEAAQNHAKEDKKYTAGYSINPLDDDDCDDDEDWL